MNLHKDHKLLPIDKEESLKKENITLDILSKEFNDKLQKINNIKEKIEKEITKIDNLYDKIFNEVTKSYKGKIEILINEENKLKDKLKNEVTKIKEKLEIFLSESNELIRINDKINKGMNYFLKEEKNMIKTLSYISKINKNKKDMNILYQQLMKNIEISFEKEKNYLKFEEYYFNGIQIPKDIEFKDINSNSFKIFWKIDNFNIINIDHKQIKFKVEIREKNNDNKFSQVYEGINNNCFIENLKKNTNYEIRICCIYNNCIGPWCQIHDIKTSNIIRIDSSIIYNDDKKKFIIDCIGKKNIIFEKLYKMSEDGDKNIFHKKCDNKGPTLCLFKIKNANIRYGGFASISWDSHSGEKKDENAFIFSINNKKMFKTTNSNSSLFCKADYGPFFGGNSSSSVAELWYANKNCSGFYKHNIYKDLNNECTNGLKDFHIDEVEVFQVKNY